MESEGQQASHEKEWVVREVREDDVPRIIELLRSNWGEDYPYPEYYEPEFVRRTIYTDSVLWIVIEDDGTVIGSAALVLNVGDTDDQMGEVGRLVVDPQRHRDGVASALIEALVVLAADTVEFAFGEARTAHPISQHMLEAAGFTPVGFEHGSLVVGDRRESLAIYARLYGNAVALRRPALPRVIEPAAALTTAVLGAMGLSTDCEVVRTVPYPTDGTGNLQPVGRPDVVRLMEIQYQEGEKLCFGSASLQHGLPMLRKQSVRYVGTRDAAGRPTGALGIHWDEANRVLTGLDLLAESDTVRGLLCAKLSGSLARSLGAERVEANVSAYEPRIQATLHGLGFRPVAYLPAAVFHHGRRLDTIRMVRDAAVLAVEPPRLTEAAAAVAALCGESS